MSRVGQNRLFSLYMTVNSVISLPKVKSSIDIVYVHGPGHICTRPYMYTVLACASLQTHKQCDSALQSQRVRIAAKSEVAHCCKFRGCALLCNTSTVCARLTSSAISYALNLRKP
jgi:hypothetical protein